MRLRYFVLSLSLLACNHEELVETTEERLMSGGCLSEEELLARYSYLHQARLVSAHQNESPPLCFYPAELVWPAAIAHDAEEGADGAEEGANAPTVAEWQRLYAQQCSEQATSLADGRDVLLADPYVSVRGVLCTPENVYFFEQGRGESCPETTDGMGTRGLSLGPLVDQGTQTYFECRYDVLRETYEPPSAGCRGMPLGNGL